MVYGAVKQNRQSTVPDNNHLVADYDFYLIETESTNGDSIALTKNIPGGVAERFGLRDYSMIVGVGKTSVVAYDEVLAAIEVWPEQT